MGLAYFVDKHGKLSLKEDLRFEGEEEEKERTETHGSTSFENSPSPQSVPSVERSTSGSSSTYHPAESPSGTKEATQIQKNLSTTGVDEVVRLAAFKPEPIPGPGTVMGLSNSAGSTTAQPSLVPGKPGGPGGPPPTDGRFFNDPLNLRTIMTGTSDGYRSPEPPSRLDTLSPLRHHNHRIIPGGGPTRLNPSGVATEQLRPSFSVPQSVGAQPSKDPGPGMEHGCGPPPPLSSSSVLPVELMAYNDLVMDIGTAQYLGAEKREPVPCSPMPTNDGGGINGFGLNANGHRRQGVSSYHVVHEPPQTVSSFGYPQPGHPSCGVGLVPAQQMHSSFGGQRPPGGMTDYK